MLNWEKYGGEGGIRTPGTLASTSDFESGAFNRALPPLHIFILPKITRFRKLLLLQWFLTLPSDRFAPLLPGLFELKRTLAAVVSAFVSGYTRGSSG